MALNTAVVYGSARRARQGIKAARFIVRQLEARGHTVTLIDSEEQQLPLLDLMYKEYDAGSAPAAMEAIAETFRIADGFIIVSGEYNHSVPAALKNLLDHFWASDDYYCLLNVFKYDEVKLVLDKYTIFEKEQTKEIYNWQQCFSRESLQTEFEAAGFAVDGFFSDVAGKPFDENSDEFAIVARRTLP